MEQQQPTPRLVTAIRALIALALIPVVIHLWSKMLVQPGRDLFQFGNDVASHYHY